MKKIKSLRQLAVPIFLETLLLMLLGQADILMLSQFNDKAAGAVGASFQMIGTLKIVFVIVSAGTSVLIAQNLGAKKQTEVEKVCSLSLVMNFLVGLLLSAIMIFHTEAVLIRLGIERELLEFASIYMKIVGGAIFFQALFITLSAILRSHGYAKESMLISVVVNILNAFGDAILIFGLFGAPVMGVKGVAMATAGAKMLSAFCAFVFLFKVILPINIFKHLLDKPFGKLKSLIKIGFPAAMENMSYNLYQIAVMSVILINLGDMAYVTRTYVWSIAWFVMVFSIAIGQANQIIIGQLVGAGRFKKAYRTGLKNFKKGMIFSIIGGLILFVFGRNIISIYTDNQQIIMLGGATLMIDGLLEPGRTFNIVLINSLRGAGDVIFPVVMAIFSMWGIGLVLAYIFGVVLGFGLPGIWIGLLIDEWLRGICMLFRWRGKKWHEKAVVKEAGTEIPG